MVSPAVSRRKAVSSHLDPQLCSSSRHPPQGDGWIHEIKYDGWRLLCRKNGSDVRLYSRRTNGSYEYTIYEDLKRWTTSFSQIAAFAHQINTEGVGDDARERRVAPLAAEMCAPPCPKPPAITRSADAAN